MGRMIMMMVVVALLAGCASMASLTPEDTKQYYLASQDEVHEGIRDYFFDHQIHVINEGDGYISGRYENAGMAANLFLGTSLVQRVSFNYRESGDGTEVRASFIVDGGGTSSSVNAQVYDDVFAAIGDYIDGDR